jgi:hypothetical protein
VFLSDGSSKALQKNVSKSLYKKIDKKSKTDFFSIFVYHVFGRFSVRGVQKHDKKITSKNKSDPGQVLLAGWRLRVLQVSAASAASAARAAGAVSAQVLQVS